MVKTALGKITKVEIGLMSVFLNFEPSKGANF